MGSRTFGFGVRRLRSGTKATSNGDRDWGVATAIAIGVLRRKGDVEWRSRLGCCGTKATSNGDVERRRRTAKSKSNSSALWVRSLSGCDLSGRSLAGRRGVLSPSLFFLYLTLTQLSLSLSLFSGKLYLKVK